MKLLFIGYLHGFGGAEKMLIQLANAMADKGHRVYLVSLVTNNPQYSISSRVEYIFIPENGNNKLELLYHRYKSLKNIIIKLKPEVIVNFWFQSAYFCAFMGKKIAQRTIYAERGDPTDKEYEGILGIIRKISFQKIGGFVFQSKEAQKFFGKKIERKSCIISNPIFIEKDKFDFPEIRDKRVVTVGRLHSQKNQSLLINAFSKLPEDKRDYVLEIYGEGELRKDLEKQIQQMNISNRVFLKGTFKDIHEKIRNASLFVLSSDYEGMPNVLLEAMALGLPCISTDYRPGGINQIFSNNQFGIAVPCGDQKKMTEAINMLLDNPEKANAIGLAAKESSIRFSPNKIYKTWEEFLAKFSY